MSKNVHTMFNSCLNIVGCMPRKLTSAHLASALQGVPSRELALKMTALIRAGTIPVGTGLPPLRDLADALGISPSTLSSAWSELRRQHLITGRGRQGMWVCDDKPSQRPARFANVGNFGRMIVTDLTYAAPDPALLPDLAPALAQGLRTPELNSYRRSPITPALEAAARRHWPGEPEAFMATNGGFEAIHLTLQALLPPGATVAIEDPTTARLLDIVEQLGFKPLAVACDAEGPSAPALSQALLQRPAAFLFQPRTHAVTSHGITARRRRALAQVLAGSDAWVIEDDGIGAASAMQAWSLAQDLPGRVIHIRSLSKSHGPDLRLAILAGAGDVVRRIQDVRSFTSGWTSRVLQDAAAWMLDDPATGHRIAEARARHNARRQALMRRLSDRGIEVRGDDGLSVWIPVPSEQYAVVTMAVRGWAVFPGARFGIGPTSHIRVATAMLRDSDMDALAEAIDISRQPL